MTYQLIASDLDGTLLNAAHHLSATTKEVVQQLVKRGFTFVIATGRHFLDVEGIRQTLNIETYLITSNGARIHDPAGKMIYQKNIEVDKVNILLQPQFCQGLAVNLYRDEGWFINRDEPSLLAMHPTSGFRYQLFSPEKDNGEAVSKIFYVAPHAHLLELKSRIEAYLGEHALALTFSMPDCLEVMAYGISKGEALHQVANLCGITAQECLAFGDGLNDYELLSVAGKGLIMGNAHDALKVLLPQKEIIGHHAEDAVARYLTQYYELSLTY